MEEEAILATETLAELYLKGENIEKAYQIYQSLLRQNPTSTRLKEKVRELEFLLRESGRVPSGRDKSQRRKGDIERAIEDLKEWLDRIQQAKKRSR
jgi:tetratricopeptide (TPR) repeat protein